MSNPLNHFWREGDGSIYPILKQLLNEKLVTCKLGNTDSDKPKKVYTITANGRHELENWLLEDPVLFQSRDELMLKVFFGWNVETKITIAHIEKFSGDLNARLNNFKILSNKFLQKKILRPDMFRFLTLKAGNYLF